MNEHPTRLHPADAPDMNEPTADLMTVTPDLASEWLSRNLRNRPVKWRKVEQYTRDMAAGRWHVTAEAIKFDTSGRLIDGQNRLHAVVRAEKPIRTMVAWGVLPAAQDVMDSGVARSVGDALTMAGVAAGSRVAAAARIAMSLTAGTRIGSQKFTNSEVQAWVMDHLDITEAGDVLGRDAKLIPLPPAVRLYAAYRLRQVDQDLAADFFQQLGSGIGLTEGSPILALRRRITGSYGANRKISGEEQLTAVFRTWNAWREGRPMKRVLAEQTGRVPDPK